MGGIQVWRYGREIEYLSDQRYHLIKYLGHGGMADVCLAWDKQRTCEVAIKIIKQDQLDQQILNRFLKEAMHAARLQHPHILYLYGDTQFELLDAEQGSIVPYLVMEYAQGGDLHGRLIPGVPYPLEKTLALFEPICNAVSFAHQQGIIHRDLKPHNILFRQLPDRKEEAVLADFGLAVAYDVTYQSFPHAGTLAYMAPEQMHGHAQFASDIYALGIIFFQLCTGERPSLLYVPSGGAAPCISHYNTQLPVALDAVIQRALAYDPAERFQTVDEFWQHIVRIFQDWRPDQDVQIPIPPQLSEEEGLSVTVVPVVRRNTNQFAVSDDGATSHLLKHALINSPTRVLAPKKPDITRTPLPTNALSTLLTVQRERAAQIIHKYWPATPTVKSVDMYKRFIGSFHHACKRAPRWLVVLLPVCLILLVSGSVGPLIARSFMGSQGASIVVTPDTKRIDETYKIQAVNKKSKDLKKHEVSLRKVNGETVASTQEVQGTGIGGVEALHATGVILFENLSLEEVTIEPVAFEVHDILIKTSSQVVIPAGKIVNGNVRFATRTVAAYADRAGKAGNIPAQALDREPCCGSVSILASNPEAFAGGQNASSFTFVTQQDVDAVLQPLQASAHKQAEENIKSSLKKEEQFVRPPDCSEARVEIDPMRPIGNLGVHIASTGVTVFVMCKAQAFDHARVNEIARGLLKESQAVKELTAQNEHYVLAGDIVTQLSLLQSKKGRISLSVLAHGIWYYQFTEQEIQSLKKNLVGKAKLEAWKTLDTFQGVQAFTLEGGEHLPDTPERITLTFVKINAARSDVFSIPADM